MFKGNCEIGYQALDELVRESRYDEATAGDYVPALRERINQLTLL
jgi:hypothetical protein